MTADVVPIEADRNLNLVETDIRSIVLDVPVGELPGLIRRLDLAKVEALARGLPEVDQGTLRQWRSTYKDLSLDSLQTFLEARDEPVRRSDFEPFRQSKRSREKRERRIAEAAAGTGSWHAACCPIEQLIDHGHVEPGSLDAVFTDPPYPREYLPAWRALGEFAAVALKPGGMLVALSGKWWLPQVLDELRAGGGDALEWRWMGALLLPGAAAISHPQRVMSKWKPVLVMTRAGRKAPEYIVNDVFNAAKAQRHDATHHHWAQSPSGQDAMAKRLLEPGWRVCDPFVGGGETALAAWLRPCHVRAFDADSQAEGLSING